MYHTTLLQKFIGTKHFAAGEKAIKSWFFLNFVTINYCYSTLQIQNFKLHFYFSKIAHSTRNS